MKKADPKLTNFIEGVIQRETSSIWASLATIHAAIYTAQESVCENIAEREALGMSQFFHKVDKLQEEINKLGDDLHSQLCVNLWFNF